MNREMTDFLVALATWGEHELARSITDDCELSDKDLEQVHGGLGKASRNQSGGSGSGSRSRSSGGYGSGARSGGYAAKSGGSGGGYGARPAQAPAVRGGGYGG